MVLSVWWSLKLRRVLAKLGAFREVAEITTTPIRPPDHWVRRLFWSVPEKTLLREDYENILFVSRNYECKI